MARAAIERIFQPVLQEYSPAVMRAAFIREAREGLAAFQTRQTEPIPYTIQVNGLTVASFDSIPQGNITRISVTFQRLPLAARFALSFAQSISPQGPTGRYRQAWFLLVDGVETAVNLIPGNAKEIILVNDEPYARKLNIRGARFQGIPPGIVERVRQMVIRRYGGFAEANIEFHTLAGGYILKRNTKRHRAGEQMTYPTLMMRYRV